MAGTALIVYYLAEAEAFARQTILSHLYSFRALTELECADVEYVNLASFVTTLSLQAEYSNVIFHYSVFAERMSSDVAFMKRIERCKKLDTIVGDRSAIIQDEYVRTRLLNEALIELNCKNIYSCVVQTELHKIYQLEKFDRVQTVLTGYVDHSLEVNVKKELHQNRSLDLVYRARKLPMWLGETAIHKYEVGDRVEKWVSENSSQLKIDISCRSQDAIHGRAWLQFLASSRTVLGSESGVSILDREGKIHLFAKGHSEEQTAKFAKEHGEPFALTAISPRHFEAAQMKTCQVLVEGNYSGVLKKNVHYVAINKDYSNLDDVMSQVSDLDRCQSIAERTYEEIICNNKWAYRFFASTVIGDRKTVVDKKNYAKSTLLSFLNSLSPIRNVLINTKILVARVLLPAVKK